MEFDPKVGLFGRIVRRRNLAVTFILRAVAMHYAQMLDMVFV
jgi:hypothetical protein